MPNSGYRSISIPEGLYLEIAQFVKQSNGRYVSVSEAVREALRAYLKDTAT